MSVQKAQGAIVDSIILCFAAFAPAGWGVHCLDMDATTWRLAVFRASVGKTRPAMGVRHCMLKKCTLAS
eukprot:15441191-Alexandrium_andersonii.AAC.1